MATFICVTLNGNKVYVYFIMVEMTVVQFQIWAVTNVQIHIFPFETRLCNFVNQQFLNEMWKTLNQGWANFLYSGPHLKKMLQPRAAHSHYKIGKFTLCVKKHIFILNTAFVFHWGGVPPG